jgi:CubicO group peptidase (beta-lactamase class C family)
VVLKVDVPSNLIQGDVDEGYGPVADEFRRNFADRGEVGAACAVYRNGQKVVDLWGGYRDGVARTPWAEDSLVTMFSTTKGVSSLALALLHTRGQLDYDQPVATYWPEFAQAGKAAVTVRQLLSHQAGLPAIDRPLSIEDLADLDIMAKALAEQKPAWTPGDKHGYHAISLGWYEGELLRRVDPQHRSLGQFFAEEIAVPMEAEFYIGLPDSLDQSRVATIHGYKPTEMLRHLNVMPFKFVLGFSNPRSLTARSFANPKVLSVMDNYNRPDVRRVELPAANGTGAVRAVAQLYGDAAVGGGKLGLGQSTLDALIQPATPPRAGLHDQVLRLDTLFSLGYIKSFPRFRFGTSAGKAFGTPGAGGSFGFADPDAGIGFAYAMNRAGFHIFDDPREVALRDALFHRVLGEMPQRPD